MENITIQDILEATDGTLLCGDPSMKIDHLSTNSMEIGPNTLFVPIIGERVDAHIFIPNALKEGGACLTQEHTEASGNAPYIKVPDTLTAMQQIAAYYRNKMSLPIIGVTGSVGKTTTREMIAHVLKGKYKVFETIGNQNSQVGVPLTLDHLTSEDEIGVLEKEYDRTDPAESTKFEREAAAKLVTFREKLERENYMRAVCDRFHIELQGMRELVASLGSKEGILRRNDYPAAPGQQRAAAPKKKKEDGVRQAEKILLTWMIEDAGIFEKVKEYISPQDFVNPLFKDVADKLYAQYESGSLNPAAIISTYDAEETHSEVAAMFSMELDNRLNHNEREKALNDTVLKVKNNSIQYQIDQAADPAQIQQLYTMKNKLSAIHITL